MSWTTRLLALFKRGHDNEVRTEDEPKMVLPASIAVLVVYDPADGQAAKALINRIQPHLRSPVRTASHVTEAKEEAKVANVAAMVVSGALQWNKSLVEAVARKLPHALVPVIVDETMIFQRTWHGAISYRMADEVQFDFCEPETAIISHLLDQFQLKGSGKHLRKIFDAFISYDRKARDMAKEIAKRLKDQHDLKIWLDENQGVQSADESVSQGIALSKVFLVLATEGYMDKVNRGDRREKCVREFLDARENRADRIVVAALEPTMADAVTQWKGQFQLALNKQSPDDLSTLSDEAITHLVGTIWSRIDFPEASSDLTPLMCRIRHRLRPCSSEAWTREKAESYTVGTRRQTLDELCDWCNKKQSAVFILVGDGDVGKSVIMAELCHRGGAFMTNVDAKKSIEPRRKSSRVRSLWRRSKKERSRILVAAYHFFRHDDGTAASPNEAVLSIAWQLCQTVSHFPEALDQVSSEGLREKTLAGLFKTILVDPLNKLGTGQMRQVVVLDALDECSKSDDVLRKIICTWKDVMPAWLSLVVSTRPEGEIRSVITNNSLDSKVLKLKDEENLRDIELHIEHLLHDMSDVVEPKDVASCAKILSERSEGLFLWTTFLPETLSRIHEEKRGGLLTLQDISHEDAIPYGLGAMFHVYLEGLQTKIGDEEKYKMLLAPIVAAREPLSVQQLSAILQSDQDDTDDMVDDASNLLYRRDDGRVALVHKRMADWLLDIHLSGNLGMDIDDGHEALAKYCSSSRDNDFSLRHAIFHLVKSGERAKAFALLNDFAWVRSAISVGDDEAQRRATIGNLISDCVELGIYFAPESDTPRFLSKAVHALSYDPNELASQVLARLGHDSKDPLVRSLQTPDQPWLEPVRVALTHPRDPLLHVLVGHSDPVNCVAIEGDTIVTGSGYNAVRIWDATSGKVQHVLKGHFWRVNSVAIQGDTVVTGSGGGLSEDRTVRIWNTTSGEEQHVLEGHSFAVKSVAIEGDTVVSGSSDKTVRIWNATSGEEQHVLKGHTGPVLSVAIQGNTIVSGSGDKTVRVWNATSGEEQFELKGHSKAVSSVAIEGNMIVSGSQDRTVRIWNAASGEEQHVLKGPFGAVLSVAIDGDKVVIGSGGGFSEENTVRIWNATSGEEQYVVKGLSFTVLSVAIEGDSVVTGSTDKMVRIWNAISGEEQHVVKGHSDAVSSVAIEGDTVVTGSQDRTVRIWDATSGKELHVLKGHSGSVRSVAIDAGTIVTGSQDRTVRIWDATSGKEQHVLEGHSFAVSSVAIESDTVVSGSSDKTVRIWNATSGEEKHVLKGHSDSVSSVAIEGDTVISKSNDGTTRYWNARTGEALDANEAEGSTALGTKTLVNIENGTHVKVSKVIGFTTDNAIEKTARQGSVFVIGDVIGSVHILHVRGSEPETKTALLY